VISRLDRVSCPSRRVYVPSKGINRVLGGLGINIMSTSRGVMTGKQARKANIGGEILCSIY
jgi:small subunit ribosomal protein S8